MRKRLTHGELRAVNDAAVVWLEQQSLERVTLLVRSLTNYHEVFFKGRLPEDVVAQIVARFRATPADVQVELVIVKGSTYEAYHTHDEANACCRALGLRHYLPAARGFYAIVGNKRAPFRTGDEVFVPQGTGHTFSVDEPGGYGAFLSSQNFPIDDREHGGEDDLHKQPMPNLTDVPSVAELV